MTNYQQVQIIAKLHVTQAQEYIYQLLKMTTVTS